MMPRSWRAGEPDPHHELSSVPTSGVDRPQFCFRTGLHHSDPGWRYPYRGDDPAHDVEKSDLVADVAPLISETMPWIAHPQIRNRGTFGGSIAHADPASDSGGVADAGRSGAGHQPAWLPLDRSGRPLPRPLHHFFGTGRDANGGRFGPMPTRSGTAMREVSRRHGDYALVGVTAMVELMRWGLPNARMTYFGVGDGPVAAPQAVAALIGQQPTPESSRKLRDLAANADIPEPSEDIHATTAYRRHLVSVLGRQALTKAFERAGGAQ